MVKYINWWLIKELIYRYINFYKIYGKFDFFYLLRFLEILIYVFFCDYKLILIIVICNIDDFCSCYLICF